jgi:putative membrane protein
MSKFKKHFRFSDADLVRVRQAVEAAERTTSGEIVPMIVPACRRYRWTYLMWAALGLLLGTGWVALDSWLGWRHAELRQLLFFQTVGAALGFCLSLFPFFRRILIPRESLALEGRSRCKQAFLEEGLTETVDRTGVLIFISLFERHVEILADRGIHERLGEAYWKGQVQELVEGIRKHREVDALCKVIGEVGARLSEHFPVMSGDQNELSDELR